MTFKHLCCVIAVCTLPLAAHAQWQWLDAQGKKVFSDQPPPVSVPDKNILRRPGGSPVPRAADPAPPADDAVAEGKADVPVSASGSNDGASAPRAQQGVDKELEAKARKAADAEKAQRAAEEQRLAKARAENCTRARQAKATYDSGMRVARVNAKGEREILDDEARAAEQRRLQAVIAADCK